MKQTDILFGQRVHIEQLRPRYVLPADVPPGTGSTRKEFEEWSMRVCGFQKPILADGQVMRTPFGLHMNAKTLAMLRADLAGGAV